MVYQTGRGLFGGKGGGMGIRDSYFLDRALDFESGTKTSNVFKYSTLLYMYLQMFKLKKGNKFLTLSK